MDAGDGSFSWLRRTAMFSCSPEGQPAPASSRTMLDEPLDQQCLAAAAVSGDENHTALTVRTSWQQQGLVTT